MVNNQFIAKHGEISKNQNSVPEDDDDDDYKVTTRTAKLRG